MAQKLIIDTDPGIDDAMAILPALGDPNLSVTAITAIFGNVEVDMATQNALYLLEISGRSDIPVARGAEHPLIIQRNQSPSHIHGEDGFGNQGLPAPKGKPVNEDAADHLIRACSQEPGEIALVPVGPLTNLGLALQRDPAIASKAANVYVMGGAVHRPGNVNEYSEANIWNDPHAAKLVLEADWQVWLLGLDVTMKVAFSNTFLAKAAKVAPRLGSFLQAAGSFYADFYREFAGIDGCVPHDALAVAACSESDRFTWHEVPINTIVEGKALGQTQPMMGKDAENHPPVQVATDLDLDWFQEWFLSCLKRTEEQIQERSA